MQDGALYYGDCLDWMSEWLPEAAGTVDLIYLDPPFNSNEDYSIFFDSADEPSAQVRGFTDTWTWDDAAAERVASLERATGHPVHSIARTFKQLLGPSAMLAYVTYMGERLALMRDLLSASGSIYLHCDPTASHYLKILMDDLFGRGRFRNEVVWERSLPKGLMTRRLPTSHDVILAYQGSDSAVWNGDKMFLPYDEEKLDEKTRKQYSLVDERGRRFQLTSLLNPNKNRPNLTYEFLGVTRVWRWTRERMQQEYERGRVIQTAPGRVPRYVRYLDEQRGRPLSDVWTDIPPVSGREDIGYDTQKPVRLLERIISLASRPGDLVLDPFCGCGTATVAAHRLERRWIGVDISAIAIDIIVEQRLKPLGLAPETFGIPQGFAGARKLASEKPFDFEAWAVTRIPGLAPNNRKRGDRGIDGRGAMLVPADSLDTSLVLAQVKGGKSFQLGQFRDFLHVLDREEAACGVFITLEPVSSAQAKALAAEAGEISIGAERYPRVQLWSIADHFEGRRPRLPAMADPYTGKPMTSRML